MVLVHLSKCLKAFTVQYLLIFKNNELMFGLSSNFSELFLCITSACEF